MSINTSTDAVDRLHKRLESVEVVEMKGDNLAVILCSYFCNGEGSDNENGWSDAALAGCAATIGAIQEHYAPTLHALAAERDALAAEVKHLRATLDAAACELAGGGQSPESMLTALNLIVNCTGWPASKGETT